MRHFIRYIIESIRRKIKPLKFEGLRESDIIPLREFIEKYQDEFAWVEEDELNNDE